jgi:hypothetical protein
VADTINQQIADALVAQQLRVARVEAQQRRDVWALLALLEADLLAALKANDPTQWALLARRRRAVEVLMAEELDPLVTARYAQIAAQLDAVMLRMATHEATQVQDIVNEATGEATIVEVPSTRQLRAGVVDGLFPSTTKPTDQATTASAWWMRQGAGLVQRLGDSLIVGVALEESLTHLTQRVRGTSMLGFQDGLMAKARQDAARLLTTQMTNTIGEARVAVAARNAGPMQAVEHTAVLDSKTSLVCLARNGLRYTVPEHDPINHDTPYLQGIPYHPN